MTFYYNDLTGPKRHIFLCKFFRFDFSFFYSQKVELIFVKTNTNTISWKGQLAGMALDS